VSERAYFRAIEDAFIELRGAPFLLSPADWGLIEDWWAHNIPLEVVLAALREVFERREERGEGRKIQSLRYCAAAVDEAWRRRRELGGARPPVVELDLDVEARLRRLVDRLPAGLVDRERWASRILGVGDEPRRAEAALAALDAELVVRCLEDLGPRQRTAVEAAADEALKAVVGRMEPGALEADRRRLVEEGARRRSGLPLLSLFSPDARF
jgi:hypothetical protein